MSKFFVSYVGVRMIQNSDGLYDKTMVYGNTEFEVEYPYKLGMVKIRNIEKRIEETEKLTKVVILFFNDVTI